MNVNQLTQKSNAKIKCYQPSRILQAYNEGLVAKQNPSDVEVVPGATTTLILHLLNKANKLIEAAKKVTLLE